jgi:hypothetical protein
MPWVIAGAGALAVAVLVPLVATQTPRLAPETRRRATTNIAVLVIMCTLITEAFAFQNVWGSMVVRRRGDLQRDRGSFHVAKTPRRLIGNVEDDPPGAGA